MKVSYNKTELGRFFQIHPIHRFGSFTWMFHYLGVLRVVYDTETQSWTVLPNFLNPIALPYLVIAIFLYTVWKGLGSLSELKVENLKYVKKIWEKKENGSYRFIAFREAPYYPWDEETKEGLKNRSWAKKYVNV